MKKNKSIDYLNASFSSIFFKLGMPILISCVLQIFLTAIQNDTIQQECPAYFTVMSLVGNVFTVITNVSASLVSAIWVKYSLSFTGDNAEKEKSLVNSVVIVFVCQLIVELLVIVFAYPILHFLNIPASVYDTVKTFFVLYTIMSFFTAASALAIALCNGLGSSADILTVNILNTALPCALLVLMLRAFNMGLLGGALFAGVAAAIVAIVTILLLSLRKQVRFPKRENIRIDLSAAKSIVWMAAVIFLQNILCNIGYIVADMQRNRYLSLEYISAQAVSIPITGPLSIFSTIVTVVVTQNYAAQRMKRTHNLVWKAFWACELYGILCGLIYWFCGEAYFSTISNDSVFVEWGAFHWKWNGIGYALVPALFVIRYFFVAVKRPGIALGAGISELFGNLLCAYILIPKFGEIGYSLSKAIGWGFATLYTFICYFVFKNKIFSKQEIETGEGS